MKRILIIDDEPHILTMLERMLGSEKYEIETAANGAEGIWKFKSKGADLVITDIIMPDKEGLETIREMRKMAPDLKIIAMSGGGKVSADNYLPMAEKFGAASILAKPFTKKEMVAAVERLLQG